MTQRFTAIYPVKNPHKKRGKRQSHLIFNGVYKKSGKWYLGWIEEIPGVNTQGRTLKEAKDNLKEALWLVLETNRMLTQKEMRARNFIREPISLSLK